MTSLARLVVVVVAFVAAANADAAHNRIKRQCKKEARRSVTL
jgi:hypothetical protein